ncbi:MAG: hypothetical protein ABI856_19395, partial [Nitrospira sp.]
MLGKRIEKKSCYIAYGVLLTAGKGAEEISEPTHCAHFLNTSLITDHLSRFTFHACDVELLHAGFEGGG